MLRYCWDCLNKKMNKCLNDILVPRYGWGPPHVNILNVPGDLWPFLLYTILHTSIQQQDTPCCSFSPSLAPIESWGWATWTLDVSLTQDMDHPCQQHTQSATLHSQYSSILHCHHHCTISVKSAFHWSRNNTHTFTLLPNSLSLKRIPIPEQSMSVTRSKHTENRKPHSDRLEITMATWQDVEKEKMRVRGAEGNGNV